ncbi:tetratricopeptide repeat protein [Geomobilimonas luticola]|uniref:DUF11 domain-containing protein n=1 Tax=Geomobilimonas luticola TaxID=1114878 RepID=A0ABS5SET4_9BACT|nr:tetratricopeptide repeat protein [Geomobilimonas luticola]MBT0653876.1 hypothetical protein [Geomobilimonas luticola]
MHDDSARTAGELPVVSAVMRCCVGLVVIALLLVKPCHASVPSDSQLFMDSFNLFRSNNYPSSLAKLNRLLAIYPDTPLRDVALLLQAQASAKIGNHLDAAQAMLKFLTEYPDSPLTLNANADVMKLAVRLQRGEKLANRLPVQLETTVNEGLVVALEKQEVINKAGEERLAGENTERKRLAAKTEEQRLARERAEQEKHARQRAEEEKLVAEKAERERLAREKAELERVARLKAEEESQAFERAKQEQLAWEKAEQERLARLKAEEERLAAERVERERLAKEKAGQEKLARQRAEEERLAAEKAERERLALEKAEQERLARLKAEQERIAREKLEQERLALEKVEQERLARLKAEQERIVAKKADQERLRREHAENERIAAQKLEDERVLERNTAIAMGRRTSAARRVGTQLNTTDVAVKTDPLLTVPSDGHALISAAQAAPSPSSLPAHSPPEFSMECFPPGESSEVAGMVSIPFTITNLGAEPDRYRITTDLPTDFNVTFAAVGRPGRLLRETDTIAPSSAFRGIMKLRMPGKSIDGQIFAASLTAASSRDANVAISKKLQLVAAAPLLSSVIKPLQKRAAPGDSVVYRLIVMNVGSMTAREVAMRLVCPPALEPAPLEGNGFRRDTDGSLVTEGIELPTGEIREFALTYRVGTTVASDTTLSCRLDTENRQLGSAFTVTSGKVLVGP